MKAIGKPIVQDELYAPEELRTGNNLGFARLALHAYSLRIVVLGGEEKTFLAPIPADFERAETTIATA